MMVATTLDSYASAAEVTDVVWFLKHLLTGHHMFVHDCNDEGCVAVLAIDKMGGGGTVQSLFLSGLLYGPSTVYCAETNLPTVPPAYTSVDATLLRAYHSARNNLPEGCWYADPRRTMEVAMTVGRLLTNSCRSEDDRFVLSQCVEALRSLDTDAERLLVLDAVGTSGGETFTVRRRP